MSQPPKILLIEDDEDDYVLTRELLSQSYGTEAPLQWAATWEEGLEAFRADGHDVYLVDYRLGARSGLDLVREAVGFGCSAPIIILTGQDDAEIDAKAMEAGATDYLVKGQLSADQLARAIRYGLQRKQVERHLARLAQHDDLTGLSNRLRFNIRLEEAFAQANRTRQMVAVLVLDLDHFKEVNDTFGHPTGDLLLKAVAQRLAACIRETDTVGRLGGDEFAIVATNLDGPSGAGRLASKVIDALARPYRLDAIEIRSRASIGISLAHPTDKSDPARILAQADNALYQAKGDGAGSFRYFDADMNARAQTARSMEAVLDCALKAEELFLLFQPRLSTDRKFLTGVEVLIRWDHPIRGILGPDEVVPLAESAGLLPLLRNWQLSRACRQFAAWRSDGMPPVPMTIGFSVAEFRRADIVGTVAGAVQDAKIRPDLLELEISESAITNRAGDAQNLVQQIRDAGFPVTVGAFGVVHGSLTSLAKVPVSRVNIERHFTKDVLANPSQAAIAKSIVDVAKTLDLTVCVKGVETGAEFSFFRTAGCHEVQGAYFSGALTGDQFAPWYGRSGLRAPVDVEFMA